MGALIENEIVMESKKDEERANMLACMHIYMCVFCLVILFIHAVPVDLFRLTFAHFCYCESYMCNVAQFGRGHIPASGGGREE